MDIKNSNKNLTNTFIDVMNDLANNPSLNEFKFLETLDQYDKIEEDEITSLLNGFAESVGYTVSSLEDIEANERQGKKLGLTNECPGYSFEEINAFLSGLALIGKNCKEIKLAFAKLQFDGRHPSDIPIMTDEFVEEIFNYKLNKLQKSDFEQICKKIEKDIL